MRFIDRTNCKGIHEKGIDSDIKSLGKLTKTAVKIAESKRLGLLKTHYGTYKVIRESGLGAYNQDFESLQEVNAFLKNL